MLRSLRLEAALSKDEILRCYLNLTPQGNNLMGVETASRVYFDKSAAHLTPAEAAVLAALAKAPGSLNPLGPHRQRLLNRRDWVLARLAQLGFLSAQESAAARQTGLKIRSGGLFPFEAPAFRQPGPGRKRDQRPWVHTHHSGPESATPGPGHCPVPPGPPPERRGFPGRRRHHQKPFPGGGGPGGLFSLRGQGSGL